MKYVSTHINSSTVVHEADPFSHNGGLTTLLINCCVGVHHHMTVKLSQLMIMLTLTSCLKGVLEPEIIRQAGQVYLTTIISVCLA